MLFLITLYSVFTIFSSSFSSEIYSRLMNNNEQDLRKHIVYEDILQRGEKQESLKNERTNKQDTINREESIRSIVDSI